MSIYRIGMIILHNYLVTELRPPTFHKSSVFTPGSFQIHSKTRDMKLNLHSTLPGKIQQGIVLTRQHISCSWSDSLSLSLYEVVDNCTVHWSLLIVSHRWVCKDLDMIAIS